MPPGNIPPYPIENWKLQSHLLHHFFFGLDPALSLSIEFTWFHLIASSRVGACMVLSTCEGYVMQLYLATGDGFFTDTV